jgi:2-oxoglutarate ferredoxin oxidoreductase subunit gamma
MSQIEIRLGGSGGQGLILAGIILAEAAILDGKNAVQSQSYGPEARGGASKAEVIISEGSIDFPKVDEADVLLVLSQEAYDKYADTLKPDGVLISDDQIHLLPGQQHVLQLPILITASDKIGRSMVANIVALGVIQGVTQVVSLDSLETAVLSRVPKGTEDLNRKALQEGCLLAANKSRNEKN